MLPLVELHINYVICRNVEILAFKKKIDFVKKKKIPWEHGNI
jgi:hypothetical protein